MLYPYLRKVTGLFILAGAIFVLLYSQNGVSATAIQKAEYAGRLDDFLLTQMNAYKIPGLAAAIVRNGEVEYLKGFGAANPAGDPVTPETPFLLASVSKSFTALGIMQLVEDGKIHLDDPVQKYLPWFAAKGEGGSEITVAHLVYQTSGFSEYHGSRMNLRPNNPDELEAAVRDLDGTDLLFKPGEGWEYSNINYSVLGLLIQEVSGQRYESYIEQNIFAPLGMIHSHTSLESARADNAARGYTFYFGTPLALDANMPYTTAILPTGGLWSSASDMTRYLIAHLDEESAALISPEGMKQLHTPGVEIEPGYNYAMGWFHAPNILDPAFLQTLNTDLELTDDLQVLWHEGDGPGYKAVALMLPGREYGVILLMNTNDYTITSVYKDFAWDVTIIASGGNAFYFKPYENFVIRNARWLAAGLILLLLGGLAWTILQGKKAGKKSGGWGKWFAFILLNLGLLAFIYLKFLPDNSASLGILLGYSPDIGILVILITLISIGWMAASGGMLMKTRSK
jgi:CubicO group peptidase (beta-lactamase class C family)